MSESEIRAQLEKVLTSEGFADAGRLGPFLRYLVEQTLAGEGLKLKESVLGVEVFQRRPDYDPRIDPIVRVEASRLRSRLGEYYGGAGAADPVRIELPKGTYVPVFTAAAAAPVLEAAPRVTARRGILLAAGVAVAAAALAAWWWAGRASHIHLPAGPPSVAVLPFVNLSEDPANEYFSDGLTEELTDALAKVEGLRVAARSSSFQYKGKAQDVREVGRRLNVGAVVEGSVRKSGERVRITAQLVNAGDGYHLWSHTYERELRDIFAIQEEIARSIVNALRVELRADLSQALSRRYTGSLEVYALYLKGRHHWNRYSREGVMRAIEYFDQAVRMEPDYAPAYAALASVYALIGYYQEMPAEVAWPKAKAAALKAISMDGTLAEAHASLGFVLGMYEWKWAESDKEFRRAIELDPASAEVHGNHAVGCLLPQGRLEEANAEFRRALELDPLHVLGNYVFAFSLLAGGQYDQAIEQYKKTIELKPDFPDMWWDLGMAYGYRGIGDKAMEAFRKYGQLREPGGWKPGPIELHLAGEEAKARAMLPDYNRAARERRWRAIDVARHNAVLGERDAAFQWLEEAFRVRDPQLVWLKVDPRFGSLRGDPRYRAMLRRVNLE